ncbi:MAG: HAMP domain-containing sensor histidine kinase [Bacteroidota bacterium]
MRAYRFSVYLKLGLILFAVLIAVASLAYTNRLVDRLLEREQASAELWAAAIELISDPTNRAGNPHLAELRALDAYIRSVPEGAQPDPEVARAWRTALQWAQSMPPASEINFVSDQVLQRESFRGIPALVIDSSATPRFAIWRGVEGPASFIGLSPADSAQLAARLDGLQAWMAETHTPIRIEFGDDTRSRVQHVFYGESELVRELRWFPYVQFLFVGLFVVVGYLGFSYIRRSEQSSLWVGMAKEAAHQLGTPISSLMGWTQLLRTPELGIEPRREAVEEIDNDIDRLRRVASRFSDIGSQPKLEVQALAPVIEATATYMRRRLPTQRKQIHLHVDVPPTLHAPFNAELFDWVIENLLKNALDAMETDQGHITITARLAGGHAEIDVADTGKGIERGQWKNIFRPGYSTKRRGWGLGLSLAKRIAEDYHGGDLTLLQSRVGAGSTFRITLPGGYHRTLEPVSTAPVPVQGA